MDIQYEWKEENKRPIYEIQPLNKRMSLNAANPENTCTECNINAVHWFFTFRVKLKSSAFWILA